MAAYNDNLDPDLCPQTRKRYHVLDEQGFIRWKSDYGFSAYDHAGNLSDRNADSTFTVIDTADGSVYGAWRNGEDVELPGEEKL